LGGEEIGEADRGREPGLADPPSRQLGAGRWWPAPLCAFLRHAAPFVPSIETRGASVDVPRPFPCPAPQILPGCRVSSIGPATPAVQTALVAPGRGPGRYPAPAAATKSAGWGRALAPPQPR